MTKIGNRRFFQILNRSALLLSLCASAETCATAHCDNDRVPRKRAVAHFFCVIGIRRLICFFLRCSAETCVIAHCNNDRAPRVRTIAHFPCVTAHIGNDKADPKRPIVAAMRGSAETCATAHCDNDRAPRVRTIAHFPYVIGIRRLISNFDKNLKSSFFRISTKLEFVV